MIFFKWYKSTQQHSLQPHGHLKFKVALILQLLIAFLSLTTAAAIVKAQEINLKIKDASIETVFNEIKKQTGYGFWYDKADLAHANKVSLNIKKGNLKETLDQCFKDQPYSYEIFDKTIVIKRKVKNPDGQINTNTIDINIQGKVTDEKGTAMIGVTVRIKSNGKIALTDNNGAFSITVPDQHAVLQFTYVGYSTIEETIENNRYLNIVLKEEANTLQSVEINAGYYTVKERERTGSISRVTAETIEKQPISNPLQALQGRVAGLQITQSTGVPGGAFSVQIRGRNSLNPEVGNDPLYVIDGVVYPSIRISTNTSNVITNGGVNPLSMVSPDDIESIEVLKDADATAIFGSRGANGVILITSKKGKDSEVKVVTTIYQGTSQVAHKMDLLNTTQYIQMRQEALQNDGLSATGLDYDVNGIWEHNKYTDWQKKLIGKNGNLTNANMKIYGGNAFSNYMIGGDYYNEGTVFPGSFGLKRGGLHSSLNLGSAKNRLKTILTFNYTNAQSNLLTGDLTSLITLAPNYPDLYDLDGKLNWSYKNIPITINPMAYLLNTIDSKTDNLIGNMNLSYRLMDNLFLKISLGYTTIKREELTKRPLEALSPANNPTSLNRQSYFGNNMNSSWIAEPQINYHTSIGLGKIEALIGSTFQGNQTKFQNILATGFNTDDLMNNIGNAATLTKYQNTNSQYKYTAIFSRVNYNLLGKYFLNFTGRRDGSSRFGPGRQFANFGAIGTAWIFSQESFINELFPFLSFGKLRGSYGLTGNDQILDYGYLQLWTNSGVGNYQGIPALTINRLSNSDYAWETTKKAEVGLQLGFLKDRINFEISYYRNRSSNQLLSNPMPPSVGSVGILVNLPATVQNQGWELEANASLINHNNLKWHTSFNLTIPRNKLISYPGLEASSNRLTYALGQPLSIRKIYNTSVDSKTGIYSFEDKDGSGTQNDNDRYLFGFIGQKFYGGFQNSISYKRISFDFLLSFVKQTGNNYRSGVPFAPGYFDTSATTNQPTAVLNRWQTPGDLRSVRKFSTTTTGYINHLNAGTGGGLSITDASYIKLKSLSLSYQLPQDWLSKLKIDDAQLSLQGQNIFTLTNYVGLDPESQSMANLPPLRALTAGLKLIF